ncbi:Homing_endonuclease [Hexamita inflata]|uniref:Homing_endonuclease n=1 Tax=Hexamita inflata TaxID=28002 RepID=A0ABP1IKJ9_9EUKA
MKTSLGSETVVRMFDGSTKLVKELKVGDQLIGDDNSARKVNSISFHQAKGFRVKYQSYLDTGYDKQFICGENAVLPVIPDGNRANNLEIHCDAQKNYCISYMEPVVDRDNKILRVEMKKKTFPQPDEALTFVDKQLPNFLYEPTITQLSTLDQVSQKYFTLVRPLLPVRYTAAPTPIQNATKAMFDQAKDLGLRSMDLPWAAGLFLSAGSGQADRICFNLKELHKDVSKELRRIFEAMKCQVEYDELSGAFEIQLKSQLFKSFLQTFNLVQNDTYTKTKLVQNIRFESFSKIRGPFLAGVMDGSADYGLADANYGLECYVRGLPEGQTRDEIADLARSCSLACYADEHGILTLAGGMLFRIPCVNNPPKDIPGLVCLTSYPNDDGQNVLLGMPQSFVIEALGKEVECAALDVTGRFILDDYTVVSV